MTYTPEQLREWADWLDSCESSDPPCKVNLPELGRAHAAALEELARLKAPVDDKRIRDSIAWLRSSYARDGASDDEQAASVIESLAAKVAELEDKLNCTQMDRDNARKDAVSAEAELAEWKNRCDPAYHDELKHKLAEQSAELAKLKDALEFVKSDIENCDWSCERCGRDYGMEETDIALCVNRALSDFPKE